MAKTNIIFNNKNYSIDDASLSAASAALKSHMSTVMSGTGASVNLDGVVYNIDSAKLSIEKDNFVSHLKTIAGSDYKIVIDGIEYGIDSAKVQDAIAEIEAVLNGLQSGDVEESVTRLLSLDNYILQDINGLYLVAQEDE